MTTFIIRRLIQGIIVLLLITIFVFIVMRLLPGDPLTLYMAQNQLTNLSQEQIEDLRHEFGLDKPQPVQYIEWIAGVLHGDLGTSIFFREKVGNIIAQRLPITIHLGFISFVVSAVLGILFGIICATRRGKWIDTIITVIANLGITAPPFWIGIVLIYIFSLQLGWLPVQGYTSPFEDFWLGTRQLIMPVFCLSLFSIASLTRQTRSSMLEVIRQDYVRTAWSKGLREMTVIFRHTVKNALIPVITVIGVQVRMIFGGAVLIETVFNVPGMGRLMVQGVFGQDYQIVQACVLIIALVVMISNLIVDISYSWFDPRIRYD